MKNEKYADFKFFEKNSQIFGISLRKIENQITYRFRFKRVIVCKQLLLTNINSEILSDRDKTDSEER
jgi:hypothetical protein